MRKDYIYARSEDLLRWWKQAAVSSATSIHNPEDSNLQTVHRI